MKKFLLIAFSLILLSATVFGCTAENARQKSDLVPVKFGHFGISMYKDLYIAKGMGYFEENGLDLTLEKMETTAIIPALIGGHLDGGAPSSMTAIPAVAAGAKIKVVADTTNYKRPEHIGYICVLKDSPYQTMKDLDGKTISGHIKGGGPDLWVEVAAEENGIKFAQYIGAPAGQFSPMLIAGKVDSAVVFGRDRVITFKDQVREICPLAASVKFGDYGYWFSEDFINAHPDAVKGFTAALQKARDYYAANPLDALKVTADYTYTTYDDLKAAYDANVEAGFPPEVLIKVWRYDYAQELMHKYGYLDEPLDTGAFVDTRFAKPETEMPEHELDWLPK